MTQCLTVIVLFPSLYPFSFPWGHFSPMGNSECYRQVLNSQWRSRSLILTLTDDVFLSVTREGSEIPSKNCRLQLTIPLCWKFWLSPSTGRQCTKYFHWVSFLLLFRRFKQMCVDDSFLIAVNICTKTVSETPKSHPNGSGLRNYCCHGCKEEGLLSHFKCSSQHPSQTLSCASVPRSFWRVLEKNLLALFFV